MARKKVVSGVWVDVKIYNEFKDKVQAKRLKVLPELSYVIENALKIYNSDCSVGVEYDNRDVKGE